MIGFLQIFRFLKFGFLLRFAKSVLVFELMILHIQLLFMKLPNHFMIYNANVILKVNIGLMKGDIRKNKSYLKPYLSLLNRIIHTY